MIVPGVEIKRDPEMNKLAVRAGSGCMAVFPISGSRLISPPSTPHSLSRALILSQLRRLVKLGHEGNFQDPLLRSHDFAGRPSAAAQR